MPLSIEMIYCNTHFKPVLKIQIFSFAKKGWLKRKQIAAKLRITFSKCFSLTLISFQCLHSNASIWKPELSIFELIIDKNPRIYNVFSTGCSKWSWNIVHVQCFPISVFARIRTKRLKLSLSAAPTEKSDNICFWIEWESVFKWESF